MAKVSRTLQVAIPKALAERYRIKPGDEVEWAADGDFVRLAPRGRGHARFSVEDRLRVFDRATQRQQRREAAASSAPQAMGRGWTRDDLYRRGGSD